MLIVPSPRGPDFTYCHLAAFIRNAPDFQKTGIVVYLFLGEIIQLYHVAGIILIASGIMIVTLVKQKQPNRSTTPRS